METRRQLLITVMQNNTQFKQAVNSNTNKSLASPKSMEQVDLVMKQMDKQFNTSFESWVRSDKNITYLCTFKRPLIDEFMAQSPQKVMNALKWMSQDWSVASVAELILKLFYNLNIQSPEFATVVACLTEDWEIDSVSELVNVLLIGEDAVASSGFIRHFTAHSNDAKTLRFSSKRMWTVTDRVDLVFNIAGALQWKHAFFHLFLKEYANKSINSHQRRQIILETIEEQMDCIRFEEVMSRFSGRLLSSLPKTTSTPSLPSQNRQTSSSAFREPGEIIGRYGNHSSSNITSHAAFQQHLERLESEIESFCLTATALEQYIHTHDQPESPYEQHHIPLIEESAKTDACSTADAFRAPPNTSSPLSVLNNIATHRINNEVSHLLENTNSHESTEKLLESFTTIFELIVTEIDLEQLEGAEFPVHRIDSKFDVDS